MGIERPNLQRMVLTGARVWRRHERVMWSRGASIPSFGDYLYVTGLSSQVRVWAFMVLVAVCFVLMMKSLVDLFAWAFTQAAAFSGRGLGRAVSLIRSL